MCFITLSVHTCNYVLVHPTFLPKENSLFFLSFTFLSSYPTSHTRTDIQHSHP